MAHVDFQINSVIVGKSIFKVGEQSVGVTSLNSYAVQRRLLLRTMFLDHPIELNEAVSAYA